jgi:hypothetical protein
MELQLQNFDAPFFTTELARTNNKDYQAAYPDVASSSVGYSVSSGVYVKVSL